MESKAFHHINSLLESTEHHSLVIYDSVRRSKEKGLTGGIKSTEIISYFIIEVYCYRIAHGNVFRILFWLIS